MFYIYTILIIAYFLGIHHLYILQHPVLEVLTRHHYPLTHRYQGNFPPT